MGILEWLKLGSDLRQMQDWISSNVIAAEPISGGLQVNISYLGIAFIVWFIHWRVERDFEPCGGAVEGRRVGGGRLGGYASCTGGSCR